MHYYLIFQNESGKIIGFLDNRSLWYRITEHQTNLYNILNLKSNTTIVTDHLVAWKWPFCLSYVTISSGKFTFLFNRMIQYISNHFECYFYIIYYHFIMKSYHWYLPTHDGILFTRILAEFVIVDIDVSSKAWSESLCIPYKQ